MKKFNNKLKTLKKGSKMYKIKDQNVNKVKNFIEKSNSV